MFDKKVRLANGVEVPQLALGTWMIDDRDAAEAVSAAIKMGYRHIGMSTLFSTVFIRSGSCTPLVSYNLMNHVS